MDTERWHRWLGLQQSCPLEAVARGLEDDNYCWSYVTLWVTYFKHVTSMLISNIVLGTQDDWCSTAFCVRSQFGDAVRGNARVRSEKWRCDIRYTDQAVLTFGDNVPRRVISMASSNCFWNLLRVRALLTTKDMAARTSRLSTITSSTCSARCLETGRPSRRSWSRSSIPICTWVSSHVVLYLWPPLVD